MKYTADKLSKIIKSYECRIEEKNLNVEALIRNNNILVEILVNSENAINNMAEIIGIYIPKIISGEFSEDDVKKYDSIIDESSKYIEELEALKKKYNSIKNTTPKNKDKVK